MGKKATAAVVREPGGPYTLESVELDDLRPNEVYVRIEAAGVCHTDANMQVMVPMPAVVGHEGVGVVEEIGAGVDYVKPGDRVIISWPACGVCPNCLTGKRYICDNAFPLLFGGRRLDGSQTIKLNGEWISGSWFQQSSFATYAIAPADVARQGGGRRSAGDPRRSSLRGHDRRRRGAQRPAGRAPRRAARPRRGRGRPGGGHGRAYGRSVPDHRGRAQSQASGAGPGTRGHPRRERGQTEDVVARVQEISPGGVRFAFDSSGAVSSWQVAAVSVRAGGTFGVVRRRRGRRRWAAARTSSCRRASASSSSWAARWFRGSSCPR